MPEISPGGLKHAHAQAGHLPLILLLTWFAEEKSIFNILRAEYFVRKNRFLLVKYKRQMAQAAPASLITMHMTRI